MAVAVVTLLAATAGQTIANEAVARTEPSAKVGAFMPVYGETLPPIGFVQFCRSHPDECRRGATRSVRETLTEARWDELVKVNDYVNTHVAPVTDQDLYHVPEHWTYPEGMGDCEDYVLLKRRYLINLGWPEAALLITVVRDVDNAGHAVLTVVTDRGEYVLDNQNPEILPWQATRYSFQKRQSQIHPAVWVSLKPGKGRKATDTLTGVLEVQR